LYGTHIRKPVPDVADDIIITGATQHDIPFAAGTPVAFGIIVGKVDRQTDPSIGVPLTPAEYIGGSRYGWHTALGKNGADVVVQSVTDDMQVNIWPAAELHELGKTSPELLLTQKFACIRQGESSDCLDFSTETLLRGDQTSAVVTNEPFTDRSAEMPKKHVPDILLRHRTIEIHKHFQGHQLPRRNSS
jgi:hypothetical protein